jgi:glycosyltransferase involved in cell wall biosynthesis
MANGKGGIGSMHKVLFDGRPLSDMHSRDRGIGVFARSLLRSLAPLKELNVVALVRPDTETPPGITRVEIRRLDEHRLTVLEHRLRLSWEIRHNDADVFHSPALEPPIRCPVPWLQTIHDVTPLVYDHPFFRQERHHWERVFRRMRDATTIVSVSRYSADAAIRTLGLEPRRVFVVPNGVDPTFRPPAQRRESDPPYVLYVGVYGPHKGYAEAFELVSELARRGYPHRLKIVGTLNPWREQEIARLLDHCEHPDRVELMGFVTNDELRALYEGASVLVVTSRCEGFGLPAVEAMATGTPVVAFDNTALPEVIGEGGVLVPDGDVTSMVNECASLIDDPSRAHELSARGIDRAKAFDWAVAARRYAELYRETASRSSR